jgi:hypothetical protein
MNKIIASKIKVFTWWSNNFGGLMMQNSEERIFNVEYIGHHP